MHRLQTVSSSNFGKHVRLPTEDPDPASAEPLSGLRTAVDGSSRALRCCWKTPPSPPSPTVESDATRTTPSGLRLTPSETWWSRERVILFGLTLLWIFGGFAAFGSGYIIEGPTGDGLTFVQSLYVMAQIITTTGYGDMTPETDAGMLFATFYILFAALLFSGMIMELIDRVVDDHQAKADGAFQLLLGTAEEMEPSAFATYHNLFMASAFYCTVITCWVLFFMFYCDRFADICEGLTFIEALYFAVVSCCGVGFGDITPRTTLGELFAGCCSIVGVATYLNLVGAISDTVLKERKHRRLESLTEDTFAVMDLTGDGSIDLYEFTRFILTRYGIVSDDIFEDIRQNFKDLDLNDSGDLTAEDMNLMFGRLREKVRRRATRSNSMLALRRSGTSTDELRSKSKGST